MNESKKKKTIKIAIKDDNRTEGKILVECNTVLIAFPGRMKVNERLKCELVAPFLPARATTLAELGRRLSRERQKNLAVITRLSRRETRERSRGCDCDL